MSAFRQFRRVASETFKPDSEHLINLPEVQDYRLIMIVLSGTLTIAGANASAIPADSPCDMIDRIDVIANGKDVLAQMPFVFSVMGNYEARFSTELIAPGTGQTAHPIRAVGYVDLFNGDGPRPKDSAFQAFLTQLFQLRLVTRNGVNAITPAGSTTQTFTGTIDVYVDSLVEAGGAESKAFKKVTFQSQQFTSANSEFAFDLPNGNLTRHIALRSTDDGAPVETLINEVQLRIDDVDTRFKAKWNDLRSLNRYDRMGQAPNAGFAYLDSTQEGKLTNFFDGRGASRVQLVCDVAAPSGAGLIEVVTTEFIT